MSSGGEGAVAVAGAPRRRFSGWLGGTVLALVVGAVLVSLISPVFNPPKWDECIVDYDARRVGAGEVPYRDFFNFTPPGVFLWLAPVVGAGGHHPLTRGRYESLALILITVWAAALLLKRSGWEPRAAWLLAALYPVALYAFWPIPSHQWLANAFLIGAWALLARPGGLGTRGWASAGLLAGLAAFTLQPQGVLALLSAGILWALEPEGKTRKGAAFAAGFSLIWLPFLGAMAWLGGLRAFWRDVVRWPMRNYSRLGNENAHFPFQDVPWRLGDLWSHWLQRPSAGQAVTSLAGFLLYGMLLTAFAALVVWAFARLAAWLRRHRMGSHWEAAAVAVTFLALSLLLRGNANWLHLVFALGPLGLLWLAWMGREEPSPRVRRAVIAAAVVLLAAGAAYALRGWWFYRPSAWEFTDADRPLRDSPINKYLRGPGVLHPGDTLVALPEGGEVYLYTAPAAIGYTYFQPLDKGYNDLRDHEIAAAQITENRPRFVLMPEAMEKDYLDPRSPVAAVIEHDYRRLGLIAGGVVYERSP